MNASDIAAARTAAVAAMIDRIRAIERSQGITRPALEAIKAEMLALAAQEHLFPSSEFPAPPNGEKGSRRYMLQEDDGSVIYLQNRGFRWGSKEVMEAMARNEPVDHADYYFRTSTKFEAPEGKHDWLNRYIFVGVGEKIPHGNQIHYYKMI